MTEVELNFVQLLTSHQARLNAYVMSLVGDPDQSADVVQETNAVLWRKSSEFELGTNFSAWMLKVAHFQVLAHRKRLARDRLVFDDAVVAELARAAVQRNESLDDRRKRLRDCLTQLGSRQRELIAARYQNGFELTTIAASMNRTTDAIKQALFRARATLIECVAQKDRELST